MNEHKMSVVETVEVIESCSYKEGWEINLGIDQKGRYVQLRNNNGVCAQTGNPMPWVSGKRYLSEWMCKQEVVGVVFDLIKTAEMHEVHEWFRYKGASIYNPHLSPDALADLARKRGSFILRPDSMERA